MSMNIHIYATRTITAKKRDGTVVEEQQQQKFDAIQTPTDVSYAIIESSDHKQAYIEYIKTRSCPEQEAIYAEDDIWGEYEPVGYRVYDWAVEHVEEFVKWVDNVEENGYTVLFEVW